jgi:hypothetical protein
VRTFLDFGEVCIIREKIIFYVCIYNLNLIKLTVSDLLGTHFVRQCSSSLLREDGHTGHGTCTCGDRSNSVIFGVPFRLHRVRNFLWSNQNIKNKNLNYIHVNYEKKLTFSQEQYMFVITEAGSDYVASQSESYGDANLLRELWRQWYNRKHGASKLRVLHAKEFLRKFPDTWARSLGLSPDLSEEEKL